MYKRKPEQIGAGSMKRLIEADGHRCREISRTTSYQKKDPQKEARSIRMARWPKKGR